MRTAIELARAGHAVAMFPRARGARKGLRKTRVAHAHTGAARIALEAGVPLVPAGIAGTDGAPPPRAAQGSLRPADPARRHPRRPRSRAARNRPPDGGDPRAGGVAVNSGTLLLAIDGDSLAHRAYHGIPKSIRGVGGRPVNALVGVRELPAAPVGRRAARGSVLVGWDTLEEPTYRHEALAGLPVGPRVRARRSSSSSHVLPGSRRVVRLRRREGRRLRGRRLPRRRRGGWDGPVLVATSDRDAFQLVSTASPSCSRSGACRSSPGSARPRCASATASTPRRFPTSSRCAATRPTGFRARPASARRRRRSCSRSTGRSTRRSPTGASRTIADDLRLYREIATMDADAPLPPLGPTPPDWARAAATATHLGLNGLAGRLAERRREGAVA